MCRIRAGLSGKLRKLHKDRFEQSQVEKTARWMACRLLAP
jgi:hypothetical protein